MQRATESDKRKTVGMEGKEERSKNTPDGEQQESGAAAMVDAGGFACDQIRCLNAE